ncbi:hypothetical protein [Streptococcus sciuri]|uniref:Uncharacterized protein n=1 Tax=Streptococcus sciuri TaxID=2973939 RepID=A0ABT2F5F2_9STRE|nr:hypothetical protein [Streptococcus sciuri]MCS4487711.1 hypothetical protein [Streptococcus sciuri]
MYYVLKHDKDKVYLRDADGHLLKLKRELFDFKIKAGDRIELYQDTDMTVVVPFVEEKVLEIDGEKSVKSTLLQGILDLFLETLAIHNNQLGNTKQIFSQFLITLFMAWSLLGVIIIEVLLFLESVLVFLWKLFLRSFKALHLIDNGKRLLEKHRQTKSNQIQNKVIEEKEYDDSDTFQEDNKSE